VLRVGRSERAGEIAFSHTGALAGPAEHEEAFLRAAGVTVVRDLRDMWSVSSLLMVRGALRTRRLAVVTTSGGVAAFVADLAADEGVELADLAPETRASLASCLGVTEVTNPVDVTGAVVDDPSLAANALSLLDADAEVGATLLVLSRTGRDEALAHALDDAGQTLTMPLFLLWLSDLEEGTAFDVFRSKGTPTFSSCREALRAFRVAACAGPPADLGTWTVSLPGSPIPRSRGRMVDESTVKCWLRELGVRTPRGHIADSPDAVVDMADKTGYPVVVKLLDQRVAHRAALGLVRVNLADRTAVADAIRDLTARAVKAGLDAAPRFLVEEYVAAQGVEWIVGVKNDLRFGPVVLFGFGGVAAEAVGDIALAPAPLTDAAADQLLRRTRVFNYWAGKMSVEQCIALRSVVVAVGALADRLRTELVELDLNPVVVTSAGDAVVLDGLGILRDSDADDEL
jgi:acetyltransferase